MRSSKRKPKTLDPVRPNVGLEMWYRGKLTALVDEMNRSVQYWLKAKYRANTPEIAQDATPADELYEAVRKLSRQWQKRFDTAAAELADHFSKRAASRSDAALKRILKKAGISIEFKMTRAARDVMNATINQQVGLIKSIPQKYLTQVEGDVMRSVQTGRDLATLTNDLQEQYGVTRRRAAFIARDQNNKATASMNRVRQQDLGITEAIWLHSGGGKEPRPEHVAFSGKRYEIEKGAFLEGVWTWPGVEINCRCVSKSIIPGL